jgi:hypothetical protein
VRSLVWDGEELVDWVAGGARYSLNGEVVEPRVFCAYPFDAAVALAGSAFAVIYTRLGTKGLVLRDGQPASFVARLIERGIEPDLRQEGLSLVFAVFPVKSLDMGQDLHRPHDGVSRRPVAICRYRCERAARSATLICLVRDQRYPCFQRHHAGSLKSSPRAMPSSFGSFR